MFKKINRKTIILLVIIILVIVSLLLGFILYRNYRISDAIMIKNEFEKLNGEISEDGKEYPEVKLSSNNVLKYTTIDDVLNILNNGENAVIYFGYPTCIYCRSAIQVLTDAALDTELDVIYYLDMDETDDKYNMLVQALGEELTTTEGVVRKVYVPLVIFVANGRVVSYNKGTLFTQEDPYQKLNVFQVEGLTEIYTNGINDVLLNMNNKDR